MDAPESKSPGVVSRRRPSHLMIAEPVRLGVAARDLTPSQKGVQVRGLIESLEFRLHRLWDESDSHKLALKSAFVLRELLRHEVGVRQGDEGVESFLTAMRASPTTARLFRDLLVRLSAQAAAPSGSVLRSGFDKERTVTELTYLLQWYATRRASLLALEQMRAESEDGADFVLDLEIHHDREYVGHRGLEVFCAFALSGRLAERLWFKTFVRVHDQYVRARPQWLQWLDDTDCAVPKLSQFEPLLAAIVPIVPDAQSVIVDGARAFLPYEAMDLPAGRHDLVIEAGVYDDSGRRICADTRSTCVSLAISGLALNDEVPSPQASGIWSHNPVKGDSIALRRIAHGLSETGSWEHEVISTTFDLNLIGWDENEVSVECRFLSAEGDLIESRNVSNADGHLGYVQKLTLRPQSVICKYFELQLQTPLNALELDIGRHDLFCELSVVAPKGEIICGTLGRISVEVTEFVQGYVPSPTLFFAGRDGPQESVLRLSYLEIDPLWSVGGVECIRVNSGFTCDDWPAHQFRVVHTLETADGSVLHSSEPDRAPFQRVIRIGGIKENAEQTATSLYPLRECMPESADNSQPRANLFAHVRAFALDGRMLVDAIRELVIKPPRNTDADMVFHDQAGEVWLADVFNRLNKERKSVSACVVLNLHYAGLKPPPYVLYYELVNKRQEVLALSQAETFEEFLPGRMVTCDEEWWRSTRRDAGWYQHIEALEWQLPKRRKILRGDDVFMKIMLLSSQGKLLQVLHHPLLIGGRICLQPRKAAAPKTAVPKIPQAARNGAKRGLFNWWRNSVIRR